MGRGGECRGVRRDSRVPGRTDRPSTRLCSGDARTQRRRWRRRASGVDGGRAVPLVTADLLDPLQGHARLAEAGGEAQLGLLRVLVLGEAGERLADRLRVLVVDADLQRARVARLVGVDRLVLDDDDDLLELVAVDLLLFLVEVLRARARCASPWRTPRSPGRCAAAPPSPTRATGRSRRRGRSASPPRAAWPSPPAPWRAASACRRS